jgi:hypothetical protein
MVPASPHPLPAFMSDSNFLATCDTCSKEFRIPDATKVYGCNQCDGKVHAVPVAEAIDPAAGIAADEDTLACPHCDELIAEDDAYCGSCGEDLQADDAGDDAGDDAVDEEELAPSPSRASSRGRGGASAGRATAGKRPRGRKGAERSKASKELVKTLRNLKTVRAFFVIDAVLHILGLTLTLVVAGNPKFSTGALWGELGVHIVAISVMIMGARMVFFRPFMWTVLLACLVTLSRGIWIIALEFSTFSLIFGVIWSLAFWAFVPAASRARRLIEENPDMSVARQFTGVLRSGANTDYALAHERAERRAWKKSFITGGIIFVFCTAVSVFVVSTSRAPSFESAWKDFKQDWNSGTTEQVAEWFPSGERGEQHARFESLKKSRGWDQGLPKAEDEFIEPAFEMETADRRPMVFAEVEEGEIVWTWKMVRKEWTLVSVRFPSPEFETIADAWMVAWNNSDIPALAELFDNPESANASLEKMASRRDWESLPAITGSKVQGSDTRKELVLSTSVGSVFVRFGSSGDDWAAKSVKAPR